MTIDVVDKAADTAAADTAADTAADEAAADFLIQQYRQAMRDCTQANVSLACAKAMENSFAAQLTEARRKLNDITTEERELLQNTSFIH